MPIAVPIRAIGLTVAVLAAAGVVVATGGSWSAGPAADAPAPEVSVPGVKLSGQVWSASAQGGGDCARSNPCAIAEALAKAQPGDQVLVAGGSYAELSVAATGGKPTADNPVVLRPADGHQVELAALSVKAPGVLVEGVRVTGTVYVHPSAVGTTLRKLHVDGAGVFLRANDSSLVDSVVENGRSVDGVQIKNGKNILVQGNTIRRFAQLDGALHSDCVQLFDVQDVTIRGNRIADCDNSGIIFSGGGGQGIRNVLVESNFVTGCSVKDDVCKYGIAIDLREAKAVDVVVRNNTFADGSVRIGPTPGQVNDRNVFGYLASCTTEMTNSIVRSWNVGLCQQPDAIGKSGNRVGSPTFVDRAGLDLHVADGDRAGVTVQPVAVSAPGWTGTAVDIDGQAFSSGTVGADEPGKGKVVGTAPSTVPPATPVVDVLPLPSAGAATPRPPVPSSGAAGPATRQPAEDLSVAVTGQRTLPDGRTLLTAAVTGEPAEALSFHVLDAVEVPGETRDGGRTWGAAVDTAEVPDGRYPVVARAEAADGGTAQSRPFTVRVGS